jgi:hypothetical protein
MQPPKHTFVLVPNGEILYKKSRILKSNAASPSALDIGLGFSAL